MVQNMCLLLNCPPFNATQLLHMHTLPASCLSTTYRQTPAASSSVHASSLLPDCPEIFFESDGPNLPTVDLPYSRPQVILYNFGSLAASASNLPRCSFTNRHVTCELTTSQLIGVCITEPVDLAKVPNYYCSLNYGAIEP